MSRTVVRIWSKVVPIRSLTLYLTKVTVRYRRSSGHILTITCSLRREGTLASVSRDMLLLLLASTTGWIQICVFHFSSKCQLKLTWSVRFHETFDYCINRLQCISWHMVLVLLSIMLWTLRIGKFCIHLRTSLLWLTTIDTRQILLAFSHEKPLKLISNRHFL